MNTNFTGGISRYLYRIIIKNTTIWMVILYYCIKYTMLNDQMEFLVTLQKIGLSNIISTY